MDRRPFELRLNLGDRAVEITESLGRIDLDNLRDEVQDAGALSVFYGSLHARAKRRASEAELTRDTVAAELRKRLRGAAFGRGEKVTETALADLAETHQDYQEAAKRHLKLQEQADILEGVKFTIARKQSTCEALVSLLVQEELARREPRIPQRTPFIPRS